MNHAHNESKGKPLTSHQDSRADNTAHIAIGNTFTPVEVNCSTEVKILAFANVNATAGALHLGTL
jgi:hypothetical protein